MEPTPAHVHPDTGEIDLTPEQWTALAGIGNASGEYDENNQPWTAVSYKSHIGTLTLAKKRALEAAAIWAITAGF